MGDKILRAFGDHARGLLQNGFDVGPILRGFRLGWGSKESKVRFERLKTKLDRNACTGCVGKGVYQVQKGLYSMSALHIQRVKHHLNIAKCCKQQPKRPPLPIEPDPSAF